MFHPEEFIFSEPPAQHEWAESIWDSKAVLQHVFKPPKEHYYGTLGIGLTARPVGAKIGEGCYRR